MSSKKRGQWRPANISRSAFNRHARRVEMKLDGVEQTPLNPKQFKTGSFGWTSSQATWMKVDDKDLLCRISMTITVVGSKHVPADDSQPEVAGNA